VPDRWDEFDRMRFGERDDLAHLGDTADLGHANSTEAAGESRDGN
jgi:hypothetical protein